MKTLVKMNFDPEIARDVGTDAAILLENIAYWIDRNRANQEDRKVRPSFQEGRWWTYNSSKAFANQFLWLSQKQIERILKKLEKEDYIRTGNFNKVKYDRTKWYALGDNPFLDSYKSISRNREIETTQSGNRITGSVEPIPNNNTDCNRGGGGSPHQTYQEIVSFCEPHFQDIAKEMGVYKGEVESSAVRMAGHFSGKGIYLANPAARLMGWIQEDIDKGYMESSKYVT